MRKAIQDYDAPNHAEVHEHGHMLFLGSYSYLGLNNHPRINAAAKDAIDCYGTDAHGVRLLAGTLQIHHELEDQLARFKGAEAALVFASGFMTNISFISCLVGRHDTIVCDKLVHASILDGAQLSGAQLASAVLRSWGDSHPDT